eukprot:gnl/MRDRNA2_/MRDRNA2_76579_c0_seq1.p1 gnl/MRDRNA2_/MRDRNA2_76579_c0~~gnl/MRDRNA2_/MRDRNA2_76579_c0_seq1.p1  ORF type:complete len:147 (+),score=12.16 gnl/MRDRNA2_/MRDRNA2_76579_c0_seq1:61-501(+)
MGPALLKVHHFSPQNLANLAWAGATFGWVHLPLLASIASASIRKRSQFLAQELGNISWAYEALEVPNIEGIHGPDFVKRFEVDEPASLNLMDLTCNPAEDVIANHVLSRVWKPAVHCLAMLAQRWVSSECSRAPSVATSCGNDSFV